MSTNPRENWTSNPDAQATDEKSNTSPKGSGASSHVRVDSDDLYPERIERLGQFLSDNTNGNTNANPDVRNPARNFFPVSGGTTHVATNEVGEGPSDQIKYTDLLDAAKTEFKELKNATAFDADVAGILEQRPSGHYLLEGGPKESTIANDTHDGAHTYVEEQIEKGIGASRWAGIGKRTISENTQNSNPFFSRPIGAPSSLPGEMAGKNTDGDNQTAHSSVQTYSHGGSFGQYADRHKEEFWDDYFKRMSRVGAAMTIKATGRDTAAYNQPGSGQLNINNLFTNTGGFVGAEMGSVIGGVPGEEALDSNNHWGKKDIENMYAGHAFEDIEASNQMDDTKVFERFGKSSDQDGEDVFFSKGSVNTHSWGQTYSWDDPFQFEGFPLLENRGLSVALEMLQVYLMCAVRAALVGALITISRAIAGKDYTEYNPSDPQGYEPTNFYKGVSRYNSMVSGAPLEKYKESRAGKLGEDTPLLSVIVEGAINQALKITNEEIVNLSRQVLRDVGLYIPTTLLTQINNKQGGIDWLSVAIAYLTATVGGLAELGVNVLAADYGKSLGFWRAVFKEVIRSRTEFVTRMGLVSEGSVWLGVIKYLGKDDKCTGFMNYLAMLGDKSASEGISGELNFPIMKVPLDYVSEHPMLRPATYRRRGTNKSTTAVTSTPSLYLVPEWIKVGGSKENQLMKRVVGDVIGASFDGIKNDVIKKPGGKILTDDEIAMIEGRWQTPEANNRFSTDQVQLMEDQLEAEYMPFYIQDLRTNEIISFHAFLTTLSDSFAGEWNGQKGFGRLEAVQTYGGASRTMNVAFTMVATSKEDFDELWWKANKLVTMVYPQWSKGTTLQNGDHKFVQPFSQVMTASPLARLRVGDLFTSNYSKENMIRLMGGDEDENFAWVNWVSEEGGDNVLSVSPTELRSWMKQKKLWNDTTYIPIKSAVQAKIDAGALYIGISISEIISDEEGGQSHVDVGLEGDNPLLGAIKLRSSLKSKGRTYDDTIKFLRDANFVRIYNIPEGSDGFDGDLSEVPSIFTSQNPIIKSFESNMGRGIAVAINNVSFDFKLGSFPWELEPGNRAPRWIDVTLGVIPIHDITPGLDHKGFNRAPVYKVGAHSKGISGDVHHNRTDYKTLTEGLEEGYKAALKGKFTYHEGGNDE